MDSSYITIECDKRGFIVVDPKPYNIVDIEAERVELLNRWIAKISEQLLTINTVGKLNKLMRAGIPAFGAEADVLRMKILKAVANSDQYYIQYTLSYRINGALQNKHTVHWSNIQIRYLGIITDIPKNNEEVREMVEYRNARDPMYAVRLEEKTIILT